MDYIQALARTTQMHIQIGNKEFYDFAKVIKVEACIWYIYVYLQVNR